MDFAKQISRGLELVETPYACLCADDDFLSISGVQSGVEFLDANLDYVTVQGTYIQFVLNSKILTYNLLYDGFQNYTVAEDDPSARVIHAFEHGMSNLYALYRTPVLRSAMNLACSVREVTVVETSTNLVGNIYGKHTTLPVFWMARDSARYSDYVTIEGHKWNKKSILDEKIPPAILIDNWDIYLKSTAGKILKEGFSKLFSSVTGESEFIAGQAFDAAFSAYIRKQIHKKNKKETIKIAPFIKHFLKKILPVIIIDWKRIKRQNRIKLPGYPSNSIKAQQDWNLMTTVIKSHPITKK